MKGVLITGMSGTGKSTGIRELQKRGFKAIDTVDQVVELILAHVSAKSGSRAKATGMKRNL